MTQTEARELAKAKSRDTGIPHVATTACANRGQFEQGKDANQWIVVMYAGRIR